jgi:hypothetical protein
VASDVQNAFARRKEELLMLALKRSVAMSVLGIGLVIAACTSPTDEEIAQPTNSTEEDIDVTDDDSEDADDNASTGSELDEADPLETETAEEAAGTAQVGEEEKRGWGHGRPRKCNHRNAWHCRRGHRGWRWVSYHPGWDGHGHGRPRRCCVRVHRH